MGSPTSIADSDGWMHGSTRAGDAAAHGCGRERTAGGALGSGPWKDGERYMSFFLHNEGGEIENKIASIAKYKAC